MYTRSAFTYIELGIVMVVVMILVVAALPDGDTEAKQQGLELAHRFEADVAYARSLSLAQPDDPALIQVDVDNNQYWVARASAPSVPVTHPQTKKPYLIRTGTGGDPGLEHVTILALDFGGDQILAFDSLGSTDQETTALLQITSGGSEYEVSVSPTTSETGTESGFSANLTTGGLELPIVNGL
jgi:hypothetical protein